MNIWILFLYASLLALGIAVVGWAIPLCQIVADNLAKVL